MCYGNETVEHFANCIVEHSKDNIKMDKPHTRKDRILYETVLPSFLPEDGSIGFSETTATIMNISFHTNTSFNVWFMDRNFAFPTLNPSIGCKPFWISKKINGLTNCTEASDLLKYLYNLTNSGRMDEQSLMELYSCPKPCSYTEYQVLSFEKIK